VTDRLGVVNVVSVVDEVDVDRQVDHLEVEDVEVGASQIVDGSAFPYSWGVLHSDRLMHPVDVSDWPVKIDSSRQLFVDDYLIAEREGLHRRLHQPKKHPANPVMVGEMPWEGHGPVLSFVLRDATSGRFRVWYRSRLTYAVGGRSYLGPNMYAESTDGIRWERPNLGIYEFEGSKNNNIILPAGDLRGLLHEPHDAAAPWKGIWDHNKPARSPEWVENEWTYLYTSPDGIRWTPAGPAVRQGRRSKPDRERVLPISRLGDTGHYRWDRLLGCYVSDAKATMPFPTGETPASKRGPDGELAAPGAARGIHLRFRLQMESDDLIHWSRPRMVAFPDRDDLARGIIGFYGLLGTTYESMWLGYLRVHRMEPWKRVDVQLMTSRDGRTWSRACERETFLPLGPEGSWDPDYSEINHAGPLLVGDELWFFYRGTTLEKDRGTGSDMRKAMGLATLRRDGFASLTAEDRPGTVTTRPLTFGGSHLSVNADVRTGGSVRVAVVDRDGRALPGLAATDCRPITGDGTSQAVAWEAQTLGGLADVVGPREPVRLRFYVENADLYAFWIDG
jgi:hypothetical protein